jgi:hypothetical protein
MMDRDNKRHRSRLHSIARQAMLETENAVKKVERRVEKSAAAMLLEARIGSKFDTIVTGTSDKGTWVRLMNSPIEGRLERGFEGLDVGYRLRVFYVASRSFWEASNRWTWVAICKRV